jgi:hypothetical protein
MLTCGSVTSIVDYSTQTSAQISTLGFLVKALLGPEGHSLIICTAYIDWTAFSGVTMKERARGKNCEIPTHSFLFILRANFRQLSGTSFNFFISFSVFITAYILFTGHFRHFSYYCRYINVTREAHEMGLSTGQMLFSTIFTMQSLKFHCFGITFICRIWVDVLNSKGQITRKVTHQRTCVKEVYRLT